MTDLPLDPNAYNVFVLYTGYVESQALSPLIVSMSRNHEFPVEGTWKEAWEKAFASFREVYLTALKHHYSFDEEGQATPRTCCTEALASKKVPRFCPDCGANLQEASKDVFPPEEDKEARTQLSLDFLDAMRSSTNDGFGEVWELSDELGWYVPGGLEPGYVTVVHSHAETLLVNYELEKETYKWDKEKQFWSESTIRILRIL